MPRRREGRDLPEIVSGLFERARAELPDPLAVNRALLELSKLYDPVSGGILLEHDTRRHIVDLLREGKTQEAREILDQQFEAYRRTFERRGDNRA